MGDPTRPVRPDPRGSNDEGLNVEQYTTLELDASTWDVFADLVVSSIHMVDAGSAVQAALHVPGGVYNIVDDEPLTKYDDATALGRAAGSRCWLRYPRVAAGQPIHIANAIAASQQPTIPGLS